MCSLCMVKMWYYVLIVVNVVKISELVLTVFVVNLVKMTGSVIVVNVMKIKI